MHPHSALQLYYFLHNVWQTLDSSEFTEFTNLLIVPRYEMSINEVAENLLQLFQPHGQHLKQTLVSMMQAAICNSQYDALLIRVTDSFEMIHRVENALSSDQMLENFVRSLSLDDPDATHEQVLEQLSRFRSTIDTETRMRLDTILNTERQQNKQNQDEVSDTLLDQVHSLLRDDTALFEQVRRLILAEMSWPQRFQQIYDQVQARKPESWSRLNTLLQQLQNSQDVDEYMSYEDYVQKNFLDDGGQQYLDCEADRACVEHMLGNLSMQR
ncbi:hypothetical protein DFQ28_011336 [Apophysomyces sp. BC1034]|nr:hypothetical protein DFQ30_003146 [Apophysomyces sp. BC1015]KAG0181197.1 hypothetical protein DFQ29_009068 [Apophysomyces sp. BC1021]KAG0191654.1 hypothetical protein DFQ28_011336 [Apophysomyces sp. BC1034]